MCRSFVATDGSSRNRRYLVLLGGESNSVIVRSCVCAHFYVALGATTREMMNLARAGDFGQCDFSGLLDYLCEAAGIEKPRLKTAKSKAAE